jgi:hypothetical protein
MLYQYGRRLVPKPLVTNASSEVQLELRSSAKLQPAAQHNIERLLWGSNCLSLLMKAAI